MKTRLFKTAWAIASKYASFSEALKAAWKAIKLASKLKSGIVSFAYTKVDGSIRKALGTLKDVPDTLGVKKVNYSLFTYFDIEADSYRCAKIENLIW